MKIGAIFAFISDNIAVVVNISKSGSTKASFIKRITADSAI
jgi:hypothetical protein